MTQQLILWLFAILGFTHLAVTICVCSYKLYMWWRALRRQQRMWQAIADSLEARRADEAELRAAAERLERRSA